MLGTFLFGLPNRRHCDRFSALIVKLVVQYNNNILIVYNILYSVFMLYEVYNISAVQDLGLKWDFREVI